MSTLHKFGLFAIALCLSIVVGCKKDDAESDDKKAGEAVTCEQAWPHFSTLYSEKRAAKAAKAPEDVRKRVIDGTAKALEGMKDEWLKDCGKQSPKAVACLAESKSMDEAKKCRKN